MSISTKQNPLGNEIDGRFILKLEIINPNTIVRIPISDGTTLQLNYNINVDWGDGSAIEVYNSSSRPFNDSSKNHTYVIPGEYIFSLECTNYSNVGTYTSFVFDTTLSATEQTNFASSIVEIMQYGRVPFTYYAFGSACTKLYSTCRLNRGWFIRNNVYNSSFRFPINFTNSSLAIVPDDFFVDHSCKTTELAPLDMSNIFYKTRISDISLELFKPFENIHISSFESLFYSCSSLLKTPKLYGVFSNYYNTVSFKDMFNSCVSIKNVDGDIFSNIKNTTNIRIYGDSIFRGMTNLVEIPENLFWNLKIYDFGSCFYSTSISNIPQLLFKNQDKLLNVSNMFYGCRKLTELPNELFKDCTLLSSMVGVFAYCNITTIPSDLLSYSKSIITYISGIFQGCKITEIPSVLLDGCTSLVSVSNIFNNNRLTKIPDNLFDDCPNIVYGSNIFSSNKITNIPNNLFINNSKITDLSQCFSDNLITEIPSNIFQNLNLLTNISNIFSTTKILSIPDNLFINSTKLSNVYGAFSQCLYLSNIGNDIFPTLPNVTDTSVMFNSCTKLKYLPSNLMQKFPNVSIVNSMFSGCGIVEIPNNFFDTNTKITSITNLFYGCTIPTIPENLFVNSPLITNASNLFAYSMLYKLPNNIFAQNSTSLTNIGGMLYQTNIKRLKKSIFTNIPNITDINNICAYCPNLFDLDVDMFSDNTKITNFNNAFAYTQLYNTVPEFWNRSNNPTGTGCFTNTYVLNYDDIPSTWK